MTESRIYRLLILVLAVVALLGLFSPAFAEKRVALVIGNSAYVKTGKLANPANDARAIADLLRRAGFEISEARLDLGVAAFKRALSDFEVNSKGANIAAFYFSGHGVQINNQTYLLPVDAELARDVDAQNEAISLDMVSRAVDGASRLRLIILDSCRDNPFVAHIQTLAGAKSIAKGLAPPVESVVAHGPAPRVEVTGALFAYAARAGTQAVDGAVGGNSPFTAAVLRHLATPGLDVQLAFRHVHDDVMRATSGRQEPFIYGSLTGGEIALVSRLPAPALPQPSEPAAAPPARARPPRDKCFSFKGEEFCE